MTTGSLTIICGSMFCGKTEELSRRIRRARVAGQYVEVFVPSTDTRHPGEIVSHADRRLDGVPVQVIPPASNLLRLVSLDTTKVVALDEAQFFEDPVVDSAILLADRGFQVLVAGLDLDYRAERYEGMARLMGSADAVVKLSAVCTRCGKDAARTQRIGSATSRVLIGAQESYEARCRDCYVRPG